MRATSSLSSGLPGTTARYAVAIGLRVLLDVEAQLGRRCFSSGPWQAKHLSDRIGRTSRLKSIAGSAAQAADERTSVTRSNRGMLLKGRGRGRVKSYSNAIQMTGRASRAAVCCKVAYRSTKEHPFVERP